MPPTMTPASNLPRPAPSFSSVRIVEVGPRDGLQNIPDRVPTATKLSLIRRLLDTGQKTVELTSLVSPRSIPQLADCREILSDPKIRELQLSRSTGEPGRRDLRLPVLVPNVIGLKRALELDVKEVAVFVSASEGFSRANINCSVQEGINRARSVAEGASAKGLAIRGYISCIFADPFDGPTSHLQVLNCVRQLLDMGCYEVSLGDTLGVGVASQVESLISYLIQSGITVNVLAGHFHDTYGQAVSNVWTAYKCGVRVFDASVAGLGGCPFAPGAKGNVATEDLVYLFQEAGIDTGINISKLVETGLWISDVLKKPYGSRVGSALAAKRRLRHATSSIERVNHMGSPSIKWLITNTGEDLKIYRSGANIKIVLNRSKNGNALTTEMCSELISFFQNASKDLSIKTIAITANGKFFCTGMNLGKNTSAVSKGGSASRAQFQLLKTLFDAIDGAPQTTIACVQGPAFGGGVGLALVCDIRLMSKSAVFTLSEIKLGLCPATISKYIIRELGFAFAREAMLSGRPILPSELLRIGAVAGVEEDFTRLNTALDAYVLKLTHCAPGAAKMCKELVELAWCDAGGKKQAERIEALFMEMMAEDSEAAWGLKQFHAGNKLIDWTAYAQNMPKERL